MLVTEQETVLAQKRCDWCLEIVFFGEGARCAACGSYAHAKCHIHCQSCDRRFCRWHWDGHFDYDPMRYDVLSEVLVAPAPRAVSSLSAPLPNPWKHSCWVGCTTKVEAKHDLPTPVRRLWEGISLRMV